VVAGLVETLASFRTLPFSDQRKALKNAVRRFQVVENVLAEVVVSGAYGGEPQGVV
jgi:hypothetical protein